MEMANHKPPIDGGINQKESKCQSSIYDSGWFMTTKEKNTKAFTDVFHFSEIKYL